MGAGYLAACLAVAAMGVSGVCSAGGVESKGDECGMSGYFGGKYRKAK